MELQNNQKGPKTVIKTQEESENTPAKKSVEPVEDMELNEEQLDIISGGGDGSNPFVKG